MAASLRLPPRLLTFLPVALLVALAGCFGGPEWESSLGDPSGNEGGDGDVLVVVHVHDEAPEVGVLPGAVVRATPADGNHSVVVLQTDADGAAFFHLHANVTYAFAADAPERIRDGVGGYVVGENATNPIEISLLHERKEVRVPAVWPGPAEVRLGKTTENVTGMPDVAWVPVTGLFSPNATAEARYLRHLESLDVRLTWTNDLTVYGDLGIGIAPTNASAPVFFHDAHDDGLLGGARQEAVTLDEHQLDWHKLRHGDALHIGPATQHLVVAPLDLVGELTVVATFDDVVTETASSLPLAALLVAAVGLVYVGAARRV